MYMQTCSYGYILISTTEIQPWYFKDCVTVTRTALVLAYFISRESLRCAYSGPGKSHELMMAGKTEQLFSCVQQAFYEWLLWRRLLWWPNSELKKGSAKCCANCVSLCKLQPLPPLFVNMWHWHLYKLLVEKYQSQWKRKELHARRGRDLGYRYRF